jgi:polyhydroxyalkanoate synthesis repressor PhaR
MCPPVPDQGSNEPGRRWGDNATRVAKRGGDLKPMNEVKVIKRYQNRKLYDTHQSCYVTLEEISQMIKNGDDLRVIDNKTKNDVTQATLTQLLYETERKTSNPVPVELLKEIIRKGDGSFSGFIRTNMKGDVSRFESEMPASRTAVSSELAEAITQ